MSEAQIDQSITHAELRVPPPNEAEAAAFAKYHGVAHSFFGMVFGGAMGLVGAEKFIKQKGMLSKPSRHMAAIYGTGFLTAFVGKELGKIYGTKQNISKAVYTGQFQNSFPDGIWKDLTISFVTGQPFDSNKHQQGVEIVGQLHPDQMFFPSEEKAQEYRDYIQRNGLQSAAEVARETRPEIPVQTQAPVQPSYQYQSYSNLRYPQSEKSSGERRNKWGDEFQ
jgi:hypothetical protein